MATTYDKASLVMIPSGVKESKLYSIKPTDGSGDFTFSRGTDTATRVNASGLIEKERSNQLLQSNTFDNAAWTLKRTGSNPLPSVTSGFSDPDGGTNAYRFQVTAPSADNDYSVISQTPSFSGVSGTPFVQSIYVKANGAGQIGKFFDLYAYQPSSASYRSVENFELTGDWQRLELFHTFNASGSTMEIVFGKGRSSAGGSTLADMATDVLIYSSQLEFGLVATSPVIETTTAAVYEGITDNLPRLDYSGGASCPSLLLEPQRTNLIDQSEYFGDWTGTPVYTANTDISPSGYSDAATLNDNTTGYLDKRKNASITANTTHTFSLFVKKTSGSLTHYAGLAVLLTGGTSRVDYGIINTTSGEVNRDASSNVNSVSYSSESYGEYWRVIMTFTDNQSNTLCTAIVYPAISSNGTSISQLAQGSNVFWGAQLEAGSYPTSYIPTYGTSATRAGDEATRSGISSLIGQTEGTLYFEGRPLVQDTFTGFSLSDGTTNNEIIIRFTTEDRIEYYLRKNGTQPIGGGTTLFDTDVNVKIAFAYKSGDSAVYVNGSLVTSNATTDMPLNLSTLRFARGSGTSDFIGICDNISLFPTRLTNAELAALTTI